MMQRALTPGRLVELVIPQWMAEAIEAGQGEEVAPAKPGGHRPKGERLWLN